MLNLSERMPDFLKSGCKWSILKEDGKPAVVFDEIGRAYKPD